MFFRSSRIGKPRVRDRLIGGLHWTGTEQIPGCRLRQRPRARRRREASHHRACDRHQHLECREPLHQPARYRCRQCTCRKSAQSGTTANRRRARPSVPRRVFPHGSRTPSKGKPRWVKCSASYSPAVSSPSSPFFTRANMRARCGNWTPHQRAQSGSAQDRIIFPETT